MFENILIALDGSELSHRIIPFVRRLLLDEPATLELVRVVSPEDLHDLTAAEARDLARGHLARVAGVLADLGYRTRTTVLEGDPAQAILDWAVETRPSAIACSSHGRSGVERWIRGSVVERLLRASPFPLLVASAVGVGPCPWWGAEQGARELAFESAFKRILVPLDGSELANAVLPAVAEIARRHESEVVLLHVARPGTSGKDAAAFEPAFAALEGVSARLRFVQGKPAPAILDAAARELFDLIALSTHGEGRSPWPFGAVAEAVLRCSSSPIFVQPAIARGAKVAHRELAASRGHRGGGL
jgi:nucleotide-binding universal stress UspA family protein